MFRAFNDNENPNNADDSLKTTNSFNNNENFSNNNDNCFNTNTTTFNYTSDDRSEILGRLSPFEPRVRHRGIASRWVDGIGEWVLETEEFKRWHNGSRKDVSYHPTVLRWKSRSGKELYRVREHATYRCGE